MLDDLQNLTREQFERKHGVALSPSEHAQILASAYLLPDINTLSLEQWRTRYGPISDMDWCRLKIS